MTVGSLIAGDLLEAEVEVVVVAASCEGQLRALKLNGADCPFSIILGSL